MGWARLSRIRVSPISQTGWEAPVSSSVARPDRLEKTSAAAISSPLLSRTPLTAPSSVRIAAAATPQRKSAAPAALISDHINVPGAARAWRRHLPTPRHLPAPRATPAPAPSRVQRPESRPRWRRTAARQSGHQISKCAARKAWRAGQAEAGESRRLALALSSTQSAAPSSSALHHQRRSRQTRSCSSARKGVQAAASSVVEAGQRPDGGVAVTALRKRDWI